MKKLKSNGMEKLDIFIYKEEGKLFLRNRLCASPVKTQRRKG